MAQKKPRSNPTDIALNLLHRMSKNLDTILKVVDGFPGTHRNVLQTYYEHHQEYEKRAEARAEERLREQTASWILAASMAKLPTIITPADETAIVGQAVRLADRLRTMLKETGPTNPALDRIASLAATIGQSTSGDAP